MKDWQQIFLLYYPTGLFSMEIPNPEKKLLFLWNKLQENEVFQFRLK